jgi:hypothetical protein
MKKVVLALGATLMAFGLSAQDHPSQAAGKPWWVSGSMTFQDSDREIGGNDFSETMVLGFSPSVGYMITDRIGAGATIGLTRSETEYENPSPNDVEEITSFNFGVFGRYYAIHTETFGFWGQIDLGFGTGKEVNTLGNIETERTLSSFSAGISPGIQYWFSPAWSITASAGFLGYRSETRGYGAGEDQNDGLEATLDLNTANFAINFHF